MIGWEKSNYILAQAVLSETSPPGGDLWVPAAPSSGGCNPVGRFILHEKNRKQSGSRIASERTGESVAERNSHVACSHDFLRIAGDEFGFSGDFRQRIVADTAADHGNRLTVFLVPDQFCRVNTEIGGKEPVISTGSAAALDMARNDGTRFNADHFLKLLRKASGNAVEMGLCAVFRPLFLFHPCFLNGHCALGNGDDREILACFGTALDGFGNGFEVVRNFGQKNDIGAAGESGVKGQPAGLISHDFDHHASAVAGGGGVNAVDDIRGDVDGGMEAESDIRSPDIIVDCFRQTDDIEPFLGEEIRCFVRAVSGP